MNVERITSRNKIGRLLPASNKGRNDFENNGQKTSLHSGDIKVQWKN